MCFLELAGVCLAVRAHERVTSNERHCVAARRALTRTRDGTSSMAKPKVHGPVRDATAGAALAKRTASLANADSLGPPDLCYLFVQRSSSSGLLPSLRGLVLGTAATMDEDGPATIGLYHNVVGVDVSSPAPIAGYVADLATEHSGGAELAAIYCSWDALAREDLRVHVSIPGGVSASVVQACANGHSVEAAATAETWQRVSFSGTLRALCPLPPLANVHSVSATLPPEEDFLESARHFLAPSPEAGGAVHDVHAARPESASVAISAPLLSQAVYRFFALSFRFEQAVHFFLPLAATLGCCAVQAAAAQRELGQLPEAILTLGRALEAAPTDGSLLLSQGELLLQCHMLAPALKIAAHAVRLLPSHGHAWLLLARAQLASGRRVAALRTLNAAPWPLLDDCVPPPRLCLLPPAAAGCAEVMCVDDDAGAQRVATFGEAVLVGAPPTAAARSGRMPPTGRRVPAQAEMSRTAAALLAEVLQDAGWAGLLQLRAEAFSMETDGVTAGAAMADGSAARHAPCAGRQLTTGDTSLLTCAVGGDAAVGDGDRAGRGIEGLTHRLTDERGASNDAQSAHAATVAPVPSPTKPLCHAWLDDLFHQMHADLEAMAAWRAEEGQGSAAGGMAGGPERMHGAATGASVDSHAEPHVHWLTRARLAERLRLPLEARSAYTRAVQALEERLDGTEAQPPAEGTERVAAERLWVEACTVLMQMHTAGGDEGASVTEALAAAHRLLDECSPQLGGAAAAAESLVAPREVTMCVYQLVSLHGLQAVRAAQRSIGEPHPALNATFHEVVEHKVSGYDR